MLHLIDLISVSLYLHIIQNYEILVTVKKQVFTSSCGNCRHMCPLLLVDESDKSFHKDSISAIHYGVNGELFVSAGDDKLVKIWSTNSCTALVMCKSLMPYQIYLIKTVS